jgi:hypothetical protein
MVPRSQHNTIVFIHEMRWCYSATSHAFPASSTNTTTNIRLRTTLLRNTSSQVSEYDSSVVFEYHDDTQRQLPVPTGCLTSHDMKTDARQTSEIKIRTPWFTTIQVFWDMTPCRWVSVPDVSEYYAAFKSQVVQDEQLFLLDSWFSSLLTRRKRFGRTQS